MQPKCLPYPMFITVRFLPGGVLGDNASVRGINLPHLPGTSIPFYNGVLSMLTEWSHDIIDFEGVCKALPFLGSGINLTINRDGPSAKCITLGGFRGLTSDPSASGRKATQYGFLYNIHFTRCWEFENKAQTFVALRNIWGISTLRNPAITSVRTSCLKYMPPTIPLTKLCLKGWLHNSVSLVSIPTSKDPGALYAFKTKRKLYSIYQEIDTLLNLPSHPNVLQHPCYLVTKQTLYSSHHRWDPASLYLSEPTEPIIGFLTHYYPGGRLNEFISARVQTETLTSETQAKWCRQLVTAMFHVLKYENSTDSTRCGIYTNLTMDNIVVTSTRKDPSVVLISFEKGNNWAGYNAPEIGREEVNRIRYYNIPRDTSNILGRKNSQYEYAGSTSYQYASDFWASASNQERESAIVFSLAACLWCIIEGKGCLTDMPERYETYPDEDPGTWEFTWPPRFRFWWQRNGGPSDVPCDVKDTVMECLRSSPKDRPTLEDLLAVLERWEWGSIFTWLNTIADSLGAKTEMERKDNLDARLKELQEKEEKSILGELAMRTKEATCPTCRGLHGECRRCCSPTNGPPRKRTRLSENSPPRLNQD